MAWRIFTSHSSVKPELLIGGRRTDRYLTDFPTRNVQKSPQTGCGPGALTPGARPILHPCLAQGNNSLKKDSRQIKVPPTEL
ncbi:hypothetical protein EYF80_046040 [Liparis tanakae]|uniref:Uncharacterized protein n=1 Tax=Liparis tanakae TaxID=230148 RepID=A0A4Z2FRI8_9TELE|nr:hypothetical protein EYF80_046040 [Liparis tanakae]